MAKRPAGVVLRVGYQWAFCGGQLIHVATTTHHALCGRAVKTLLRPRPGDVAVTYAKDQLCPRCLARMQAGASQGML